MEDLERRLCCILPGGLFDHVIRTRQEAIEMATECRIDPGPCALAALLHDCCRHLSSSQLLKLARGFGIVVNDIEQREPVLLHGPVGAEVARRDYGVMDNAVLNAIRYHTTGRAGMTPIEQVVYLADKIEPGKRQDARRVSRLSDLKGALLEQVNGGIIWCINEGLPVHPRSTEMRNWLLGAEVEH